MNIPESQLEDWAASPSSAQAKEANERIRGALASCLPDDIAYEVYLQGSYANRTNISVDSDIDIVVELTSSFINDFDALSLLDTKAIREGLVDSSYGWKSFRTDVLNALESRFGSSNVQIGNNCLKLRETSSRLSADIVPCIQYRRHISRGNYVKGIKFWTTKTGQQIVNYPKAHIENGEIKNTSNQVNGMYKHIVRIFKHFRRRLEEESGYDSSAAPSYFIECAIYNLPDTCFQAASYSDVLIYVLAWLLEKENYTKMLTVSKQQLLFGPQPWQWNLDSAVTFFRKVAQYNIR